jgi:hypothetical protein
VTSLEIDKGKKENLGMAENTKVRVHQARKPLPPAVPVQVQGEGFRCLAYRDKTGAWIDYHSGEPLKGPVKVIEYGFD